MKSPARINRLECYQVKSTAVNWRKWALYGALIALAYTGVETHNDLETKTFALFCGKLVGSIVAGAILGCVAALVRNRYSGSVSDTKNPDRAA